MSDQGAPDLAAAQVRAARRRKRMTVNVAKSFAEADRWDLEFWQSVTPEGRLSAFAELRRDVEKALAARESRKQHQ